MPSSTRWRLHISASNDATYVGVDTLTMASSVGGANLCTGGTPSASTAFSGFPASWAFDAAGAGTYWSSSGAAMPQWLEYQFASAVSIVQYSVKAQSAGNYTPKTWTCEYWDGSAWQVVDTRTNQTGWGAAEVRTFTVTAPTEARLSQVPLEVLTAVDTATVALWLSQLAVEVLHSPVAPPTDAQVSQVPLEVLLLAEEPSEELRATQLVTELASQQATAATVTQVPLELAHQRASAIAVTQALVEIARDKRGQPGVASVTHLLIEILRTPLLLPEPEGEFMPTLTDDLGTCPTPTTALVNLALARIGINQGITDLASDQTAEAAAVRLAYDLSLDAILRDVPWPFATHYALLALSTPAPPMDHDWAYAYALPSDCVFARRLATPRARAADPTPPPFRLGGGQLWTNESPAQLEYTRRPLCPAVQGDATFRSAWAWRLAHDLAPALSRLPDRTTYCWAQYEAGLEQARRFLRLGSPGQRSPVDPAAIDAACPGMTVQVVNLALVRIGAQTVANLDTEQSRESVLARLVVDDELVNTLADFPWPFATRYVDPVTCVGGPAWPQAVVAPYTAATAYAPHDAVLQAGTIYYALTATTGVAPPTTGVWTTTPPASANVDWRYSVRTPTDAIVVRRVARRGTGRDYDPDPPLFRLGTDSRGGLVYVQEPDPVLEVTVRPPCSLTLGGTLFRDAVAWRLAAVLVPSLAAAEPAALEQTGRAPSLEAPRSESGDVRRHQERTALAAACWQQYQAVLRRASATAANEAQVPPTGLPDWIRGR